MSDEAKCDKLIADLYGSGSICRMGTKGRRTRNTNGVPDRLYWCGPRMVWFEVKSENDYLSVEQIAFLLNVLLRGGVAGCGNREDLLTLLNAPNARKVGEAQIEKYRTRQKALRSA